MDKQSFNELLAAARNGTLEENIECLKLEREFQNQDRDDLNALSVSMSWREQLIANMEDIIEAQENAKEQEA